MSEKTKNDILFVENLKKQWMATVDAIQDPIMIIDQSYRIKKANQALANLAKSDIKAVIGSKCYQAFANRESPCPGCLMLLSREQESKKQFELNNIRANEYHEVNVQPLRGPEGQLEGVVSIYRDRTEAKAFQEKLLQSEKLASIGLLAGGIAHEINNPLGGILIFSQMLLREMEKESEHYSDIVEIEAAAQRCKEIVESLLDFARAQPTTRKELIDVDVKKAIQSALKFCLVGTKQYNIDIREKWELEDHHCKGDKNKMIQLFLNLIQNAIQAMPSGGILTLGSEQESHRGSSWSTFTVSDTGTGISKEDYDKIFDPFFTSKPEGEGTGLGLSICHGIVSDFNGFIEVKSELGVGTTFKISFPTEQEQTL